MRVSSIYFHIPFCLSKCNYCDFVSYPCAGREQQLADYPRLLLRELELYRSQLHEQNDELLLPLQTIYFGGGTPSLLEPAAVGEILSALPAGAQEITLEANPETVDGNRLCGFREAGINRLSLGVQSFNDGLLRDMGRAHSADKARQAVAEARAVGFENIGIDLIYGLPNQSMAQWQRDLEQALQLQTEHISLYSLSIEPDTPWGRLATQGQLAAADDDLSADMLEYACDTLSSAGLHHYEISNFARPGFESRHNSAYWQRDNYLGLGVAAAGCLTNHRIYNLTDIGEYAVRVTEGQLPIREEEFLDIDDVMSEAVFLGLRLDRGIDFDEFRQRYGVDARRRFRRQISRLLAAGLLECDDHGMRLTHRGMMLGNQAFAEFV